MPNINYSKMALLCLIGVWHPTWAGPESCVPPNSTTQTTDSVAVVVVTEPIELWPLKTPRIPVPLHLMLSP